MRGDVKERGILFSGAMVRAILDGTKTETRRVMKPQPYGNGFLAGDNLLCFNDYLPPSAILLDVNRGGLRYTTSNYEGWEEECPLGRAGERLWVREAYYQRGHWEPVPGVRTKTGREKWRFVPDDDVILFEAPAEYRKGRHHKDPGTVAWHKRLGRFMPRAASRITLEIDEVRVERLHEIDEEGARAEGLECRDGDGGRPGAGYKWSGRGCHAGTVGEWGKCFHTPADDGRCRCVVGGPTPAQCAFRELWERINGPGSWDLNPWVWVLRFHRIDATTTETREAAHA